MPGDMQRFVAKCEFMPASGCVLWRGGTKPARDGTERTGVFWHNGKSVVARRWAAEHVHGIDLMGKEVGVSCGEPLCVQHLTAEVPGYYHRQFYVLRDLNYCELDERKPPTHDGAPFHEPPEWMTAKEEQ